MFFVAQAVFAAPTELPEDQAWALQLGYFADRSNAMALKERLSVSGFDVQVISTSEPGDQRYRVIGGWADAPEELDALRSRYEDATGSRGYVVQNPYLAATDSPVEGAADPFEPPRTRYLLAQAGDITPTGGEGLAATQTSTYDPGVFRTPQEEIDSIPGFTAAGMQIVPTLGLSLGYDDNITRARSGEEIDSNFYMISPAVVLEIPSDRSVLAITAAGDWVRYEDSPIDDRDRWHVRGDWAWDISNRQDLNVYASYGEGMDARGTGRRQGDDGLEDIPLDEWQRIDYGGIWRYGAIGSRGKLDVRAGGADMEYTNNRDRTYLLDRDWNFVGGTFFWRVAPKTSVLADVMYTDINYDWADNDSEETSWMLGLSWDASARTSGTIRYGNQKKDFDNPELADYDGPTWLASVSWQPRTYSLLTLTGTRRTHEPDGNADYVLRQDLSLAWVHDWATRFGTVVDVGVGEDDYRPDGRTDDLFYWSVGARYTFNPHFRFGASAQSYDRDSEDDEFTYNRLIYMLTLEASF